MSLEWATSCGDGSGVIVGGCVVLCCVLWRCGACPAVIVMPRCRAAKNAGFGLCTLHKFLFGASNILLAFVTTSIVLHVLLRW